MVVYSINLYYNVGKQMKLFHLHDGWPEGTSDRDFNKEDGIMIEIIAGVKGKGKTKILLEKVNEHVKATQGTIVYLDKNNKHMYELSNRVRLIEVPEYDIASSDMFVGFIAGIVSQDHDLDKVYLDSFLTIAKVEDGDLEDVITKLQKLSDKFHVDFVISASMDKENMPAAVQEYVSVAL